MSAPTIVSGHVTGSDSSSQTNHVVTLPTNASGDIIFVAIASDDPADTFSLSGYTALYAAVDINAGAEGAVFYKTSGGSEGSTVTVVTTVSERCSWIAWAVRSTAGIEGTATATMGTSTSADVPAVTTTGVNRLRLSVVMTDGVTTPHGTATNSHTKLAEISATSAASVSVHSKTVATASTDPASTVSMTSDQWAGLSWAMTPAAGTLYSQSASGGLTPSGALVRKALKLVAGTVTPSGEIIRKALKLVAGGLTPSGAVIRKALKLVAGSLTLAGALATQKMIIFYQAVGGTLTLAGAIIRKTSKAVAGSLTPAGAVIRKVSKLVAGAVTSSGALVRKALKVVAGAVTPSGALASRRLLYVVVGGALTLAGSLAKKTKRAITGALTLAGTLATERSGQIFGTISLTVASVRDLSVRRWLNSLTVAARNALTVRRK